MIDWAANTIANKLISSNVIELDDQEIYLYGLQMMISGLVKSVGFALIAWFLGWIPEAFVFIVTFSTLRLFAGGYHADTYLKCFLITASATFISIFAVKVLLADHMLAVTATLISAASLLVIRYAPIDTPNKRFVGDERSIYRKKTLSLLALQVSTILLVLLLAPQWMVFCNIAAMALIFEGITLLPVFARG